MQHVGFVRGPRNVAVVLGVMAMMAAHQTHAQGAGVKVALIPAMQAVAPGDSFDLSCQVTRAGDPFNAFDLNISWNPAAVIESTTHTGLSTRVEISIPPLVYPADCTHTAVSKRAIAIRYPCSRKRGNPPGMPARI